MRERRDSTPKPYDYVWRGRRITHYLNHGGTWQGAPATEDHHYTLRAAGRPESPAHGPFVVCSLPWWV